MTSEYSEIQKMTRIESLPSLKLASKMSLVRCSLDNTNTRIIRSQTQLDSADSFQYNLPTEAASCNLDALPSQSRDVYKRYEPASLLQLSETDSNGEVSGHNSPRSSGVIGPKSILRASKFSPSSKSQEVASSFGRNRKAKRVTFSLEIEKENFEISDEILSKFKWSAADATPQSTKIEKVFNDVEQKKGKQIKAQTGWLGPPPPTNELLNSIRSKRGRKLFLQNLGSKLNDSNQASQPSDINEQKGADKSTANFMESFASRTARNFQNNLKNKKLPPILPSFSSIQNLTPIGKNRIDSPYKDQEILIQAVYIDSPNRTGYKLNTPNVTFAMPKKETKNKSIFASGNIWAKTPDMKDTAKIFLNGSSRP